MAVPTYTREQLLTLITTKLAGSPNTIDASEHRELEEAIVNAIYGQVGDIKELAVDQTYIATHFNITGLAPGLGKSTGERYGWAICNGYNGTIDKGGNVSVGYDPSDPDFDNLTQPGINDGLPGTKKHTLSVTEMPPHNHAIRIYDANDLNWNSQGSGSVYNYPTGTDDNVGGSSYLDTTDIKVTGGLGSTSTINTTSGGTVAHNNMQPYIVTLFIQRVPTP
jgi:hypothetical protein